jgi:chaperonin GroEL (HSP60 family)
MYALALELGQGADSQGIISNIFEENVVQPLLVSTSALELATETVALILRIDDIQVSAATWASRITAD